MRFQEAKARFNLLNLVNVLSNCCCGRKVIWTEVFLRLCELRKESRDVKPLLTLKNYPVISRAGTLDISHKISRQLHLRDLD